MLVVLCGLKLESRFRVEHHRVMEIRLNSLHHCHLTWRRKREVNSVVEFVVSVSNTGSCCSDFDYFFFLCLNSPKTFLLNELLLLLCVLLSTGPKSSRC